VLPICASISGYLMDIRVTHRKFGAILPCIAWA
jgi:hypothetical protein